MDSVMAAGRPMPHVCNDARQSFKQKDPRIEAYPSLPKPTASDVKRKDWGRIELEPTVGCTASRAHQVQSPGFSDTY